MNWRTGGKKIQKFCGRHIWKPPYCIYSIEKFESSHGMAWGGGHFHAGVGYYGGMVSSSKIEKTLTEV